MSTLIEEIPKVFEEYAKRLMEACEAEGLEGYSFGLCLALINEAHEEDVRTNGQLVWHVGNHEYGGAMAKLGNVESWCPGCIAFKKDASEIALLVGGNYQDGGENWILFSVSDEGGAE